MWGDFNSQIYPIQNAKSFSASLLELHKEHGKQSMQNIHYSGCKHLNDSVG